MAYNLTEKQLQLVRDLVRLCDTSQHKSFSYTPTFNSRDNIAAHGTNVRAAGSERDLRTLEADGLIALRWVRHGAASGTVLPRAFDAVRENFGLPRGAPAADGAASAPAAAAASAPAIPATAGGAGAPALHAVADDRQSPVRAAISGAEILAQLSRSLADLSPALRESLPPDEAEAAGADAAAITRQLNALQPDPEVVARRTRSILAKVAAATGSASDLADKGDAFADALRKLAPFVALVGQWIESRRRGG